MIFTKLLTFMVLVLASSNCYRLPTIYSPTHYEISLVLPSDVFTLENATTYTGNVNITFKSSENVSQVVLHASATHINVSSVSLILNGTESVSNYSTNATTDIFTVLLGSELTANQEYVLSIAFNGTLSTSDMYGFYKSSYTDSTNTTQYLATTQMEATYARRAFPCFDEPSYKATFNVSLTYPSGLNALGNMGVLSSVTSSDNTTITTTFNQSPVMSTYLVAFIVSKFTCSSGNNIEGLLPYQVCSRNETSSIREWALEVAPLAINSLNSYLGINYSANMGKLDQVAIPDFSAGAMENWGLITYRERALLYDQNETSHATKEYIASVISHELAHQWFGNLVTCKWWSEIFLNEGFATFFEYFTTHEIYPDYEMDKQFIIEVIQYIFEDDASTSESLRKNASTPGEISNRFSGISYEKGGSILRMVEHILGTAAWKNGLNTYLNQYAHSSTEPDDLWTVLNSNISGTLSALNLSLNTVMANWINLPGYPVLSVSLNGSQVNVSQKRFVLNNSTNSSDTLWYVPITYTTSDNLSLFLNTTPSSWLTPSSNLSITLSENVSWIILNNQLTGYYRVNYDSVLWSRLAEALRQTNFSGISEINRAQIVDDSFALAKGGYLNYSSTFNTLQFLSNETSYFVWYPSFSGFNYLLKRIGINSTLGAQISSHVLNLTQELTTSVPLSVINETSHIYTLTQVLAQAWACKLGSENCTVEAVRQFEEYKNTSVRPNKNLRSIVYCNGLKHSTNTSADWDFLWSEFLGTTLSTEQVTILSALGCSSNETILKAYLQKTLIDDSGIRSQDYASVFSAVYLGSSLGVNVALDFFIDNYNSIISRYTSMNGVGNILRGIAEQITTNEQVAKLEGLISSGVLQDTVLEAANKALSSANANLAWVSNYSRDLYAYYGIEEPTTSSSATTSTTTTSVSSSTASTTGQSSTTTQDPGSGSTQHTIALVLLLLGLCVTKF